MQKLVARRCAARRHARIRIAVGSTSLNTSGMPGTGLRRDGEMVRLRGDPSLETWLARRSGGRMLDAGAGPRLREDREPRSLLREQPCDAPKLSRPQPRTSARRSGGRRLPTSSGCIGSLTNERSPSFSALRKTHYESHLRYPSYSVCARRAAAAVLLPRATSIVRSALWMLVALDSRSSPPTGDARDADWAQHRHSQTGGGASDDRREHRPPHSALYRLRGAGHLRSAARSMLAPRRRGRVAHDGRLRPHYLHRRRPGQQRSVSRQSLDFPGLRYRSASAPAPWIT